MDEGIEGRMDEGRDGEKDEEKKKSTPEVIEKEAGKSKITPKIDPKWFQNRPKRVPKRSQDRQKIKATSSRRSWTPLGGDFPAIVPGPGAILGAKIDPKS